MGLLGFYLGLAAIAALGLWRTVASQSASRRYLEAAHEDEEPKLDHLSRPLSNLVLDARALRLALDGVLRTLAAAGPLGVRGSDADELDSNLLETSRELGEWLAAIERLSPVDRQHLDELSPEASRIRGLFEAERFALERRRRRGRPSLRQTVTRLLEELRAFEENMQRAHNPYR